MSSINFLLNSLFELLLPSQAASPWPLLLWASAITASVLVFLFAITSNQTAIRDSRNRFLARSMELLMFQHDLRVSLTACGRILAANGRYLSQFLLPMTVATVPLLVILIQVECWLAFRPLKVGEQAVLTVKMAPEHSVIQEPVQLRLAETLQLDSQPVRTPSTNEVAWRIRATADGPAWIDVIAAGFVERKSVVAGPQTARISTRRESGSFLNQVRWPSEPPLKQHSPILQIHLNYPHRQILWNTTEVSWMAAMVGLTIVMSLVFGQLFGIRVA